MLALAALTSALWLARPAVAVTPADAVRGGEVEQTWYKLTQTLDPFDATMLQERCSELMSKAALFVNGSRLNDIAEGDPRTRLQRGGQALIAFTYPSLRMLRGTYDEALLTKTLLEPDDLLGEGTCTLAEAEQEVLTYVLRAQKDKGERLSIEDMVRDFGRRPYGWPQMATLVQVARLFRLGKIELRTTEILDAKAVLDALKSSRQHGTVRVRIQDQFDPSAVAALKAFHHDFFDRPNDGTDARSAAQLTQSALAGEGEDLQLLVDQRGTYPFLADLEPIGARIESWLRNRRTSVRSRTMLSSHCGRFSVQRRHTRAASWPRPRRRWNRSRRPSRPDWTRSERRLSGTLTRRRARSQPSRTTINWMTTSRPRSSRSVVRPAKQSLLSGS